jgi:hypothetical protein
MRPLTSHVPDPALSTCDTVLQPTQAARVCRRAHAVQAGGAGPHVAAVAATCPVAHAALRPGGQRLAQEGLQGVRERPRSGRPPTVTGALAHRPAIAWALPPPSSLAPLLPSGVAAHALPCAPHRPVSSGAAHAAAGSEKKERSV